jgi:hypothetical protein
VQIKSLTIENAPFFSPINLATEKGLRELLPDGQWSGFDRWKKKESASKDFWILQNHFTLKWGEVGGEGVKSITLKKGWITDFASVPLWARGIVNHASPKWQIASFVHDAFYACQWGTREQADSYMIAFGRFMDVSKFELWKVKTALRLGGGGPWKESEKWIDYEKQWANFNWSDK